MNVPVEMIERILAFGDQAKTMVQPDVSKIVARLAALEADTKLVKGFDPFDFRNMLRAFKEAADDDRRRIELTENSNKIAAEMQIRLKADIDNLSRRIGNLEEAPRKAAFSDKEDLMRHIVALQRQSNCLETMIRVRKAKLVPKPNVVKMTTKKKGTRRSKR
jgi:hypothetical protein